MSGKDKDRRENRQPERKFQVRLNDQNKAVIGRHRLRPTDQPTNRPTDKAFYRDAGTFIKKYKFFKNFGDFFFYFLIIEFQWIVFGQL